MGVQPGVAFGHGVGALTATEAAGVFGLEDGLRLAMARPEAMPDDVATGAPSLTLIDTLSGLAVTPDDARNTAYWHRLAAGEPESLQHRAAALAAASIGAIIGVGQNGALKTMLPETGDAPGPALLPSFGRAAEPSGANGAVTGSDPRGDGAQYRSVAGRCS